MNSSLRGVGGSIGGEPEAEELEDEEVKEDPLSSVLVVQEPATRRGVVGVGRKDPGLDRLDMVRDCELAVRTAARGGGGNCARIAE